MPDKNKKKHPLLLVDDEPEILFTLKGLLRKEFELHTAESGQEALEILREHEVHVVMTDQRMPEMTGVELMGRVKNQFPETIRVVFTGYADTKAVIDAINNGGLYRYLTKPWDPDELIEVLHEATSHYDKLVEKRHLLADLREHVTAGQALTTKLLDAKTDIGIDADQLVQFRNTADSLAERLTAAIESASD